MRQLYTLILLAIAFSVVSCNNEESYEPDRNGMMTIKAKISDDLTKSYIAEDGRTLYWSEGDALGIFTQEGTTNAKFTAQTAEDAYNGDFIGSTVGEKPQYGYYPYDESYSGNHKCITLNLASEQMAESISSYNFMGSNSFVQSGTNDYAMEFYGLLSVLEVKIDATDTPLAEEALKSVKVQALPLNEGNAVPAVTGDFKLNLEDLSTTFEGENTDYAKLVWTTPHNLTEGIAKAYMFVNPEAFSVGTQMVVTIETENGSLATAILTCVKDFKPHTRYDFNLDLSNLADKVIYEGNPLVSLTFAQSTNQGKLVKSSYYTGSGLNNGQDYVNSEIAYDITCTYDEKEGIWKGIIPYLYDFNNLVATFTTIEEGSKVYVNGVEQTSGVTANDFNDVVTYEVVSPSGERKSAKVKVVNSGLPVVTINGTVYSKNTDFDDIEGTTTINIDGTDYTCGLRLRGNSTQNMPKKPYAIKLDSKAEILGMPKHKRWVLLANWLDRTMLRNDLAFYIARQTGSWAPRGKNVEVVLNGVHVGNYWLGEQIKIDENRLDIADYGWEDLNKEVASPTVDDVASKIGYLLECDQSSDETEIYFKVNSPVPFYMYIKDPGDASEYLGSSSSYGATLAYTYIVNYVSTVNSALSSSNWSTTEAYLDYKSFADHWIMTELTENQESKHPKSFYMYKDAGGKLCAGPAWDYDWGTFIPMNKISYNSSSAGYISNYFTARYTMWYPYLFKDSNFIKVVKERWAELKSGFESAVPYLESQIEKLRVSDSFNSAMWPCTGFNKEKPNFDEDLSFDAATSQMRQALIDRINWLDKEISSL